MQEQLATNMPAHKKEPAPQINTVRIGYARGIPIPWQIKMGLKVVLASVPLPYRLLSSLGIFRHGDVTRQIGNLESSFRDHFNAYKEIYGIAPKNGLELGPGDSTGHALCAHFAGMESLILNDVDDYASIDEEHYRAVFDFLSKEHGERKKPESFSREGILDYTNSRYLTQGLESLKTLESDSIELSFSHAVFEHIKRDEFAEHMKELYRIHKKGTLSRHHVDLHDHLGGALNSFRFAPEFWESKMVQRAGFYTNRLTMDEMVKIAEEAGFDVSVKKIIKWEALPTPRSKIHEYFDGKGEKELNICTFLMHMVKP